MLLETSGAKIMRLQETTIFFQKNRYRHYYLCHYLPLCSGIDAVSRSLLKFKRGAQPDLDNWIGRSLRGFHETPVVLSPDTIIIRALRHRETRHALDPPSPLDRLGLALAGELGGAYVPHLLYKVRPTLLNQGLLRGERMTELQNVYRIEPTAVIPAPSSILLLDDILTTGATVLAVLNALLQTWPACTITVFTLAKTQ